MASRLTALVLVAVLLVAGGCTGTESSAPTTAPQSDAATTSPIGTTDSAQSETSAQPGSGATASTADPPTEGISIRSGNDSGSVVVVVRANTSLASSDPAGNNPGEPYFAILVNGETVRETREVNHSAAGRYAFELDSARFPQSGSGTTPVTVVLTDRDSVFDDEIARWSTSVDAGTVAGDGPSSSETAATETLTDRATRTPATTATSTPTTPSTPTVTPTSTTTTATSTTTTPSTPITTTTRTATAASETGSGQSSYAVEVVEVIDGDTATIEFRNGSTADVRFLGVDTPEVHTDNDPAEFEGVAAVEAGADCLRDWGHKASEFTRSELLGERVTVTFDSNEGRRGSYGRLLVYVHHDDELFNYELVTQGYARMYDSEFTKRSRFASAESSAQRDDVGLWECTDAESTTETTTASDSSSGGSGGGDSDGAGSLSVARIHADAPDNDHNNLNEEYMVFENTGDDALDLSGWVLEDAADHTYVFPDGFSLGPDETVTVYTGSGSDTDSELYWGSGSAVWNNGGDTIIVTNANGDVVLRREYSG